MAIATFAAGCFWGVELKFSKLQGVISTQVGYMGGNTDSPTYQQVCTGTTYHAEVVQVVYDESVLDYSELLNLFWQLHDPTTLNRQGPDTGTQYRSAIFCHNPEQKAIAEQSKQTLIDEGAFRAPIVTQITTAGTFWKAEDYHQKYLEKRGMGSCGI